MLQETIMWEKFKLIVPLQIRWVDVDALQHINNAVYLSYLEYARVQYWLNVLARPRIDDLNFIIAEINIRYRAPASLRDTIAVGIRADELRNQSFKFFYEIWETQKKRLLVEAWSAQVTYDYGALRPVPIPETMRRDMEAFESREDAVVVKIPSPLG
jgi:acyl-CoA thioester hydrolase